MRWALISLCLFFGGCSSSPDAQTLTYGQGATRSGPIDLVMDFYSAGEECLSARPTLVYIHGGGFADGSREEGHGFADLFLESGFNLASLDYRKIPDDPIPSPGYKAIANAVAARASASPDAVDGVFDAAAAAFEDTVTALTFLQARQNELCHDPGRVVLMGTSAGAITALHVAYSLDERGLLRPSIRGVISNCGGFHILGSLERRDVPLLHLHSRDDTIVPFSEAELLWSEARRTGTAMVFMDFDDQGHCPDIFDAEAGGEVAADRVIDFAQDAVRGAPIQTARL